jgi:membrane-bound serine protease (ClpP class)
MNLLESPLLPNLEYLVLVGGLWLAALAIVAPGTGVLEALAFLALTLGGLGMLVLPLNAWAVVVLLVGAVLFGLSLWRRREAVWLALSAVALSVGSAFLFRTADGSPAVHPLLAATVSILTLGFFWLSIRKALQAAHIRPSIDPSSVVGQTGEVRTDIDPTGSVFVGGELWTARADQPVRAGSLVRVRERDGLILIVDPVDQG